MTTENNIKVQPFALTVDRGFIVITDIPQDVYDVIFENLGKEAIERIDDQNTWIMELTSDNVPIPDDIEKIFVALSRSEVQVTNFLNGAFFAESLLNP
jgi:hypothetical protein